MNEAEIRLECLRMARTDFPTCMSDERVVERAVAYAGFVMGKAKSPNPMQAQPATLKTEADPHNPNVPGHEVAGYVSPPTT